MLLLHTVLIYFHSREAYSINQTGPRLPATEGADGSYEANPYDQPHGTPFLLLFVFSRLIRSTTQATSLVSSDKLGNVSSMILNV